MTVVDDLGIQNNWGRQNWNKAIDVFRNFKKAMKPEKWSDKLIGGYLHGALTASADVSSVTFLIVPVNA